MSIGSNDDMGKWCRLSYTTFHGPLFKPDLYKVARVVNKAMTNPRTNQNLGRPLKSILPFEVYDPRQKQIPGNQKFQHK